MSYHVKRLRIFAGPNGSGKSTLYEYLVKIHAFNSYFHINADNIARDLPLAYDMNNLPLLYLPSGIFPAWFNTYLLEKLV